MSNRKRRTSSLSSLSFRILSKYGTLYRPGNFLVNRLCTDSTLHVSFIRYGNQTDEFPSTKGRTYVLNAFQ